MSSDVPRDMVERFRDEIARRVGLHFDDAKLGMLADVLERRMRARGVDAAAYLRMLSGPPRGDEIRALAQDLTVAETFFFRNLGQLDAFLEVALPERLRAGRSATELHVLSAGCATGEEPYSLAILLLERGSHIARAVRIRAVDLNPANLTRAERGRYSPWSLRETPPELRERWFREEGKELELDPAVRKSVAFREANLAEDDAELWRPGSYDVVFCRNVVMYFTPAHARALIERITRALAPGGYLFLGHAETLRGVSSQYHLRHSHGTFYYRRKAEREEESGDAASGHVPTTVPRTSVAEPRGQTARSATVDRASERIRTLPACTPLSSCTPAAEGRRRALELLKGERFDAALVALDHEATETDPDTLLLRAALLTHRGSLDEAEQTCRALLALDELSAAAHYLLGLCRAASGNTGAAIHHHEVASYLDPGFAMSRLQLGLLLRRAGDVARAARELQQALMLLHREDVSRLLLFGGGFGREALIALCHAELQGAGGQP